MTFPGQVLPPRLQPNILLGIFGHLLCRQGPLTRIRFDWTIHLGFTWLEFSSCRILVGLPICQNGFGCQRVVVLLFHFISLFFDDNVHRGKLVPRRENWALVQTSIYFIRSQSLKYWDRTTNWGGEVGPPAGRERKPKQLEKSFFMDNRKWKMLVRLVHMK